MPSRTGLGLLALSLGFTSTTVQVLVIREQLVALTGNELSIAVTIAAWILLVAAGSLLLPRLAPRGLPPVLSLLIIAGLAAPFQVVSVRALHAWISPFGEIVGPGTMMALAACGVFPSATALGALFVALVGLAKEAGLNRPVGFVYGLEGLGAGVAGLLLSVWLLEEVNPVAIAGIAGMIAVAGALYLLAKSAGNSKRPRLILIAVSFCLLAAAVAAGKHIDKATRQAQWRPLKVEATIDSKYGNLVVASRDSIYDFFETGSLAFTIPDRLYAEEAAHIPLLHHPEPHQVLVVGGAGAGVIVEIVKHKSVRHIDYIDIDPVMISTIKDFAPQGWMDGTPTAGVRLIFADAREYIARTRDMYDVVILNVGRPTSLQANRYYTVEFFRSVEHILDRNGLLAVKIAAEGAYVGPEVAALVGTVADACRATFPMVTVLPGDYVHVLASPGLDLRSQTQLVIERLKRRGIDAAFVNQFVLWDRLSPSKIAEIDSVVAAHPSHDVNSDLRPVSFSLAMSIWEKQMSGGRVISGLASSLTQAGAVLLVLVVGIIIALASTGLCARGRRLFPSLLTLYSMGLVTMATQMLTIFAFQVACGYIYTRIAAVVAAFMAGMGLASLYVAVKRPADRSRHAAALLQVALAVPPVLALATLRLVSACPGRMPAQARDLAFSAISFLTGALGGLTFAVVSAQMIRAGASIREVASVSYWMDLAGATVAGLATGLVLIPALGIAGCSYSVAAFSLLVAAALTILPRFYRRPRPH